MFDQNVSNPLRESADLCNEARDVVEVQIKCDRTPFTDGATYIRPADNTEMIWAGSRKSDPGAIKKPS